VYAAVIGHQSAIHRDKPGGDVAAESRTSLRSRAQG
jgi:hypothetical protein